jgi:hypothetical protein
VGAEATGAGYGWVAAPRSRLAHASRQPSATVNSEVPWRAALFLVCEEATATFGWIRRAMSRIALLIFPGARQGARACADDELAT